MTTPTLRDVKPWPLLIPPQFREFDKENEFPGAAKHVRSVEGPRVTEYALHWATQTRSGVVGVISGDYLTPERHDVSVVLVQRDRVVKAARVAKYQRRLTRTFMRISPHVAWLYRERETSFASDIEYAAFKLDLRDARALAERIARPAAVRMAKRQSA